VNSYAPGTAEATNTNRRQRCAVCDHDLAIHDAIGHRYCHATQALALPRRCICRDPVETPRDVTTQCGQVMEERRT
jgi:hypothetical protein